MLSHKDAEYAVAKITDFGLSESFYDKITG